MKHAFRTLLALAFVCSAAASAALAQTPTPDPSVLQITSSAGNSFARDISGDGRFVVIESTGDIATLPPNQLPNAKSPNNADGNLEIFLFDYAQRRIFQITDTRSQLVNPTAAADVRFNPENIRVAVVNTRPSISRNGQFIVFSSNAFDRNDPASSPFSYDGNGTGADAANIAARLRADGNTELFVYRIPDVPAANLSSGETPAYVDLRRQNGFTRVTNTDASRLPRVGTISADPFVADDNRNAQVNDDGSRVVFISTRNLAPTTTPPARNNADGSPEVFAYTNGQLIQLTDITQAAFDANPLAYIDNPNISGHTGGASVVAFVSNATNLRGGGEANIASSNADGNAEIFVADFNGTALSNARQLTLTRRNLAQDLVNILSPGRRLSRNGNFLGFESVATNPRADTTANEQNRGLFVYNFAENSVTQVTARAANDELDSVFRFPTFTGDNARLVWVSDLNLTATGGRLAPADNAGLNPLNAKQIFSTALPPASGSVAVSRLTNTPEATPLDTLEPFVSNTQERISFSLAEVEFGGGNPDGANEAFYLITPTGAVTDTPAASSALAYFTGATRREVGAPSASPTPSPAAVTGLAPGMIGVVARTAQSPALAPAARMVCPERNRGCDDTNQLTRQPPLPVELGGVSVSVGGAAAGLYFVSPDEIQFVVPPGLAPQTGTNAYPVVITIRGEGGAIRTVRSTLQVQAAVPDIDSSTDGPGGRAEVTNVTNRSLAVGTAEPFTVTTTYVNIMTGQQVTEPTRLRLMLTGVRGVARGSVTVRLVKSDGTNTDITSTNNQIPEDFLQPVDNMPGSFTLDFLLPASLAGAGDVKVVVLVTINGVTFSSRPAETAPSFRIN